MSDPPINLIILAGILNNAHQQSQLLICFASSLALIMSTKRVRFGSQSVKSSTRSSGTRSGSKATKEVKAKKKPDWDVRISNRDNQLKKFKFLSLCRPLLAT